MVQRTRGIFMIDNSTSRLDKRHYLRQPITTYVELDEDNGGIIVDASEGGLRVQAVHELEAGGSIRMRFQPSPTSGWAEAKGRIIWTSQTKKVAGIEFSNLRDMGHQVLRGLLCEPSWPNSLNQGLHSAEPNATDPTNAMATKQSEAPRTDPASVGRLDAGAAPLSQPGAPNVAKLTRPPAGIFSTISREIDTPSTRSTAVVLVILSCLLVSAITIMFWPDVASGAFQTIYKFISEKSAPARPTEGVSVAPSSVPIQPGYQSPVSSTNSKPSPPVALPAPRPTEAVGVLASSVPTRRESQSGVGPASSRSSPPLPSPSPRDSSGFVLQVAAMEHVENANALVESLKRSNFPAFVSRPSGNRFYKALVGPYDDRRTADIVKEKLTMQGMEAIETRWSP
jgi:cell division septation protein DedD